MVETILYAFGFFVFTLVIQLVFHKLGHGKNERKIYIWTGSNAILTICVIGLITGEIKYLSAVIGFVIADEFGKSLGWH